MTMQKSNQSDVPAAQALQYTIDHALYAMSWLKKIEEEWQKGYDTKKDVSHIRMRSGILVDTISVYISVLRQKDGDGHSLLNSYTPHDFIKKFIKLPVVEKCKLHRHNRCGHQSKHYGHAVSSKEILESELESYLKEAQYFLQIIPEKN